jgi:predicted nicotinamide N-methyase
MSLLPDIPGGWTTREIVVAGRSFHLTLPASPDAFLDDPAVRAASECDDYMPYWPYLWPAALPMAEAVARADWRAGTDMLEIGAGIGFVGLVALSRGCDVMFTDYQQPAVDLALHNARQNGFESVRGEVLDWRSPGDRRYSVILGCDVLYETRNHQPILELLDQMLAPGGSAWFGDAGRQHAEAFVNRVPRSKYALCLRDELGQELSQPRVGKFQLITLKRAP